MTINEIINIPILNVLGGCYVLQGRDVSLHELTADCRKAKNGQLVKISRHKLSRIMLLVKHKAKQIIILEQLCEMMKEEYYLTETLINELRKENIILQRILKLYNRLLN